MQCKTGSKSERGRKPESTQLRGSPSTRSNPLRRYGSNCRTEQSSESSQLFEIGSKQGPRHSTPIISPHSYLSTESLYIPLSLLPLCSRCLTLTPGYDLLIDLPIPMDVTASSFVARSDWFGFRIRRVLENCQVRLDRRVCKTLGNKGEGIDVTRGSVWGQRERCTAQWALKRLMPVATVPMDSREGPLEDTYSAVCMPASSVVQRIGTGPVTKAVIRLAECEQRRVYVHNLKAATSTRVSNTRGMDEELLNLQRTLIVLFKVQKYPLQVHADAG